MFCARKHVLAPFHPCCLGHTPCMSTNTLTNGVNADFSHLHHLGHHRRGDLSAPGSACMDTPVSAHSCMCRVLSNSCRHLYHVSALRVETRPRKVHACILEPEGHLCIMIASEKGYTTAQVPLHIHSCEIYFPNKIQVRCPRACMRVGDKVA